jgi:hypothetical protein
MVNYSLAISIPDSDVITNFVAEGKDGGVGSGEPTAGRVITRH